MQTVTERHHLMSPSMKMADLMDIDFSLLGVLNRMGLPFGFGEDTVDDVCRRKGLHAPTFLLLCNVYAFEGFIPTKDMLDKADLQDILKYLHLSHAYYMDVALGNLAQALTDLTAPCPVSRQRIFHTFFAQYKDELTKHFDYEERVVFPHVRAVLEGRSTGGFKIGQYEENHSNVEEKLDDLKSLVMKYMPAECDPQAAYRALFYIFSLEADLRKHTSIEDDILVPLVNRLENHE